MAARRWWLRPPQLPRCSSSMKETHFSEGDGNRAKITWGASIKCVRTEGGEVVGPNAYAEGRLRGFSTVLWSKIRTRGEKGVKKSQNFPYVLYGPWLTSLFLTGIMS